MAGGVMRGLTDDQLRKLYLDAAAELSRREAARAALARIDAAMDDYAAASGQTRPAGNGEPWVEPASVVETYRAGDVVEHAGAEWCSLQPLNDCVPGVEGWEEA